MAGTYLEPPPPGVSAYLSPRFPNVANLPAPSYAPPMHHQPASNISTLIVKHVPTNVEPSTMEEVFRSVGAVAVRPCNVEGKLRGVMFVDFGDAAVAARAKDQLHGYARRAPESILKNLF